MKRLRKSQDGPAAAPAGEVKEEEEDDEDDEIEEVSMQVVLADQVECKEEKVKVKRKRAKAKAAPRGKLRKPKLPQFAFEKFREEVKENDEEEEPSLPELVTRWKAMSDEERGRFIQLAEEDRRRFEREYEEWREERAQLGKPEPALQALLEKRRSTLERKLNRSEEPPKKLVSKKRAPKNFPKRPVNSAYSLFCSEQPKMSALPEEEAPEPVPSEEGVAEDAQKAKQRRSAGRLVALQKAWSALSDEEWRWRNQQVFDSKAVDCRYFSTSQDILSLGVMEASPVKVAIIGAGLGGLTLAKTLVEGSGVEVCLYEAWDQWKVRGGALGLAAGERILKSFGLGEKLEAVANHGQDLQVHFGANGKRLGSLDFTGCMAMRTDLQKLLVDSLPPQIIKLGHKVTDIVEGDEEVLLTFENGATASAHLVVAADGIHSFVRQRVFGKDSPIFTGFRMLYSVSTKPYRPNPSINNIHWMEVDGVGYGILELTAGQDSSRHDICALILQSKEEVTDRWDSTMVRERFEQVAQQLGDLAVLKTAVENSEVCFDWGIYRSPERETWISPKGRTVLLGDAAHATAPFMGQGANMAMHDAYCLGQILLNPKISLSDGLQLYESSRKAHCESVVARSSIMGQVHTAAGLKASLRNTFLSSIVLPSMQSVLSTDPTEQKPWDTAKKPSSLVNCASGVLSLLRHWGKSVGRMCS
ncbi:6-hydroxynicotinate 3-monooxygenase (6-HNA monooxygenase) (Nicotinate degradation protein C) [Durusdinium trenchii]|uniref:6-hydroxynicotinate 3-monooxygenase (6-HNA monooxygenase) (Nicotinate degradation protein C) n=1 Tax=Durusdinium trenchii TaxID=1381693 RepID=A0ABP0JM36_9DINO